MSWPQSIPTGVLIHLVFALSALMLGPLALWTQSEGPKSSKLHRYAGRVWVLFMLIAVCSALAIRGSPMALWQGFGLLHLLIPLTLIGMFLGLRAALRKNFLQHRRAMQQLYVFALLIPGAFTLLPNRLLGGMLWGE